MLVYTSLIIAVNCQILMSVRRFPLYAEEGNVPTYREGIAVSVSVVSGPRETRRNAKASPYGFV